MSSSLNEDQEQRKTTSMEESNAMRIEFLRARLLSERSVSKTARQRADELAKRVAELEEQLKFVSLQRKKAEKATAEVLAILENRGISDVSEEFDSLSEQDESHGSGMMKETSTNLKLRKNEKDAYSSSEVESSPSTGRSLSWKSTKDSQNSLEKKKCMDSIRRRASFASNSSSARRIGKSCRRIRRRDTRSMEELQNDGTEKSTYSRDASNCSDIEPVVLRGSSGYDNGENPQESPLVGSNSVTQKISGHYFSGHERDEDMESALQHQAQLIGQYEEEEKAQREWEEKFRENNSGTQDSCDPGNHSDVTEERYEIKSSELSGAAGTSNSDNQEMKQDPVDAHFSEQPQTSKNLPSLTDADKGSQQDKTCCGSIIAYESSASEFSFPMSKEKTDQESTGKQHEASAPRCQRFLPMVSMAIHPSANISSSQVGKTIPPYVSPESLSSLKLEVVPQETSNNLGSVLEALRQAKSSLNQKLNSLPPLAGGTSDIVIKPSNPEINLVDNFKIPTVSPGLFRLPTDNQFEATTRANLSTAVQSSFADFHPQNAPSRFLTEPFVGSTNAFSGDLFLTVPHRTFTPEIRPGIPLQKSLSQPRLGEVPPSSNRMNHLNPYANPALPLIKEYYPFLPDIALQLPMNEGTSRTFPSSESGLPPSMRLTEGTLRTFPSSESELPPFTHLTLYDEQVRPNMYR